MTNFADIFNNSSDLAERVDKAYDTLSSIEPEDINEDSVDDTLSDALAVAAAVNAGVALGIKVSKTDKWKGAQFATNEAIVYLSTASAINNFANGNYKNGISDSFAAMSASVGMHRYLHKYNQLIL